VRKHECKKKKIKGSLSCQFKIFQNITVSKLLYFKNFAQAVIEPGIFIVFSFIFSHIMTKLQQLPHSSTIFDCVDVKSNIVYKTQV
jgi:hypothetical protein